MEIDRQIDTPYEWDYFLNFGADLNDEVFLENQIKEKIQAFSCYIRSLDHNYYYNETFLPLFVDEFLVFIKSFYRKYSTVRLLFGTVRKVKGLVIVIDRYWKCEFNDLKGICTVYETPNWEWINADGLKIECAFLTGARRYLFYKEIPLESDMKKICAVSEEIDSFVENYTKGEEADGSGVDGK